jgi:hypothetical protein
MAPCPSFEFPSELLPYFVESHELVSGLDQEKGVDTRYTGHRDARQSAVRKTPRCVPKTA